MGAEENKVESRIVKRAKEFGGEAVKMATMFWPDRQCVMPDNEHFFIEAKAPNGRLSKGQKRNHARLRKMGHRVYTTYSRKMVDVVFKTEGYPVEGA